MKASIALKDALLGLAAGILATVCFLVGARWVAYLSLLIFPVCLGLFLGLLRRSSSEAWRGALAGLLGMLFGFALFTLHGTVFLRPSLSMVNAGVPPQVFLVLTSPIGWALAFIAAAHGIMKGSIKAGFIGVAICFIGVGLLTLLGPTTTQLKRELMMRGEWLGQYALTFFDFAMNGFVLGIAVHVSDSWRTMPDT